MGLYSADDLKKWQEKMLAMPAAQRAGQQDPKAVIDGNKPDVKGALTPPTAAPTTAAPTTATPAAMPSSSLSPAPMDAAKEQYNQDARKDLASTLKQFARGETQVDSEQMVKDASAIGVSREQLSGLYKEYRKEYDKETEAKKSEEFYNRPSALTRYDKKTGEPVRGVQGASGVQGAVGGLSKGPSPTGGTPIGRGGRSSLPKEMQNIAAANLYRAGQDRILQNEQQALNDAEQRARIEAFLNANKPLKLELQ